MTVAPNGTIGILGGGQLGRMLATAAARLGLNTHIYCPEDDAPARAVAAQSTIGSYTDAEALTRFGRSVGAVTYEFENVPAETVEILSAAGVRVAPGAKALSVAQDRVLEKEFARALGAATAPFEAVDSAEDLAAALKRIGAPAILKTRRLGYDGKGQTVIRSAGDTDTTWREATEKAWREIGARPSILEGFVDFAFEISVIGVRSAVGEIALYDPPRNEHQNGILRRSTVPSGAAGETLRAASDITKKMLGALDYVGVIGVEFFVLKDGSVAVNEFAPRVHNSGHWTSDACAISQFENHIRAIAGWPLGSTARHSDAVMENLLGDEAARWEALAREPGACVHLYGKRDAAPGRKMGHVTRIAAKPSS
ncbi:MAG: 5-(carboxyamino)imidazole ribonucleotide synthase [Parvularculaceae bacterium]|nr:5-(carboxyamino)imidazole ribonucleotide synthase [Parvularculaceae bacterium]